MNRRFWLLIHFSPALFSAALLHLSICTATSRTLASEAKPTVASKTTPHSQLNKKEFLVQLRERQSKLETEVSTIEEAVRKQLAQVSNISIDPMAPRIAKNILTSISDELEKLNNKKAEISARKDVLGQIIFVIETRWSQQPIQGFLHEQLLDLASTNLAEGASANSQRLWKFLSYLSVAVREVPDPSENLLNFIEDYMRFSTVLQPKTPAEFLANRHYTDGTNSVAAEATGKENLGEFLEKREKEIEEIRKINPRQLEAPEPYLSPTLTPTLTLRN